MILVVTLWCLFGLIAGAIAQFVMPGKDPGESATPLDYAVTTLIGMVGAALGGGVASRLCGRDVTGFNLPSLAVAIGGAVVLLLLYRMIAAIAAGPSRSARGHSGSGPQLIPDRGQAPRLLWSSRGAEVGKLLRTMS